MKKLIVGLIAISSLADQSFEVSSEQVGKCYSAKYAKNKVLQVKLIEATSEALTTVELSDLSIKKRLFSRKISKTEVFAYQYHGGDGDFNLECDGGSFLLERISEKSLSFSSDFSPAKKGCFGTLALRTGSALDLELIESKCN